VEICLLIAALIVLARGLKTRSELLSLAHFETLPEEELPGVSVLVAARNEEDNVEAALSSLLNLDYPDLEVVFVDDRSTDRTAEIAYQLAASHPAGERLKVLRCRELPPGWLGKIHAQHMAAKASNKPLVLLTDADVVFDPRSLKVAASAQQVLRADHLVGAPIIETRSLWEQALVSLFLVLFVAKFRPSRVHRDRKRFVGVGAFSMLTRQALDRLDFLEPLRLQVIDDVHLGRLVKSRGMVQYALLTAGLVRVRWVAGVRGVVLGLEKNSYAGLGYNRVLGLLALPLVASAFWLPLLFLLTNHAGWAVAYLLIWVIAGLLIPAELQIPRWIGLTFPLAALVLTYTFARSIWLTEKQGGVKWRDTLYPLEELRAAHQDFVERVAPL